MSLYARTSHAGLRTLLSALFLLMLALASANAQTQPAAQPAASANNPTAPAGPNAGAQPAATPQPSPTPPYKITVGDVTRYGATPSAADERVAGVNDVVVVKVNNLGEEINRQAQEDEARAARGQEPLGVSIDPNKLVLFLDDVEMKRLYPEAVNLDTDEVRFKLRRDEGTIEAWNGLLAMPEGPARANVRVGVGPEGKSAWPLAKDRGGSVVQKFNLKIYNRTWLRIVAVLFLLALGLFLWLARKSNIIRDSQPPELPEGMEKPYSLARAQVAWWFFIILGSFLFLGLVLWDYNTLTTSSLVLLGIGTGTALGSAMVDASKRESSTGDLRVLKPRQAKLQSQVEELRAQIAALAAKSDAVPPTATPQEVAVLGAARTELSAREAELEQVNVQVADAESARKKPVSEGFLKDILSDANGVAFHRFQIIVWTVVLGVIFIWTVWSSLHMPVFNEITLALMGISAGTYLGFKIPERQTEAGDAGGDGGGTANAPTGALPGAATGPEPGGGGQTSLPPGDPNPPTPTTPPPNETPGSVPVDPAEADPNSALINTPAEEPPPGDAADADAAEGEEEDASGDVKLGGDDDSSGDVKLGEDDAASEGDGAATGEGDASVEEAIGGDMREEEGGAGANKP